MLPTPNPNTNEVIVLALASQLRVAGETIEGEVQLNFAQLQRVPLEEVHVKLRGSVFTKITRQQGESAVTRRQRIELVRQNVSVWRKGTAYPAPDTHILSLPFRFILPGQLLPSCEYNGGRRSGAVAYSIEVVGTRSGLHFNKRIQRPLALLPPDQKGAELSRQLRSGWTGPWRTVKFARSVRKGIWGSYSHVTMNLMLPAIDAFPVFTPIPFTLNIVTVSKPMRREDIPQGEPIFPAPPLTPKGVTFKLERSVFVQVHAWRSDGNQSTVAHLGGLSPEPAPPHFYDAVRTEGLEKVWVPELGDEKKQKGTWKQEVNFLSNFQLACPPTFKSQTMGVDYWLSLKVGFPGIGNDLKGEVPIVVVSSMLPPGSGAWDGPPPEIDLPPAYFSNTNWDHDEKDT